MIRLLIIADDFTGALDTGVHFSEAGAAVKVVTNTEDSLEHEDIDVLVLDSETRHLNSQTAYEVICRITRRAAACGIPFIFKKTDSALRGNAGSELSALLAASGEKMLPFIPALPGMNRITREGIQYIEGFPVAESVFGKDPFDPVLHSYIPDILRETLSGKFPVPSMKCIPEGDMPAEDFEGIAIFDAASAEYLQSLAAALYRSGKMKIVAGCAGLAEALPGLLGFSAAAAKRPFQKKHHFLTACGSVNPITCSQLDYAERHGFQRIRLSTKQKLAPEYWNSEEGAQDLKALAEKLNENPFNIIDSNDAPEDTGTESYIQEHHLSAEALRFRITSSIGLLLKKLIEAEAADLLMIVGGDTLLGFMQQIGASEITPFCEVLPGSVISEITCRGKTCTIISKSGGFGQKDLLVDLAGKLTDAF